MVAYASLLKDGRNASFM